MTAEADQCMYGLKTSGPGGREMPAQNPTRLMTNSWAIAGELDRRCDGTHKRQPLLSGRAGPAAIYPKGICEAICRGLLREMKWTDKGVRCLMTLTGKEKIQSDSASRGEDTAHEEQEEVQQAWDDITGSELDGNTPRQRMSGAR